MNYRDILIVEKRNIITDLQHKSFLFIDLCKNFSERDALRHLPRWYDDFLYQAVVRQLPQIQIRFPFKWQKFHLGLQKFGYKSGLFVVEKNINRAYALPKGVRTIHDAAQIKNQLVEQQHIHFQFNSFFFNKPSSFRYNEYLGDLQKRIGMKEGVLYGLYYRKTMIGFIGLEIDNSSVYINELFVEEKYRGKGFGKILMQAGFHYAVKTPHRKIWTTLASQNDRGLRFYKSCGFHELAKTDFMNLGRAARRGAGGAPENIGKGPACVVPGTRAGPEV